MQVTSYQWCGRSLAYHCKPAPFCAVGKFSKRYKTFYYEADQGEEPVPQLQGWQTGYAAFTYKREALYNLIEYVKNQEAHHGVQSFEEEYIALLEEHKIGYDEKYLFAE